MAIVTYVYYGSRKTFIMRTDQPMGKIAAWNMAARGTIGIHTVESVTV